MVEKLTLHRRLYQVNYFNLLSLHREIGMLFALGAGQTGMPVPTEPSAQPDYQDNSLQIRWLDRREPNPKFRYRLPGSLLQRLVAGPVASTSSRRHFLQLDPRTQSVRQLRARRGQSGNRAVQ